MCSNNLRELKLQEGEGLQYSLLISEDEYQRATTDITFAQELLDSYKSAEDLESQHSSASTSSTAAQANKSSSSNEAFWTDAETILLISLYNDNKVTFQNATKRKHLWVIISEQMAAHNYYRAPDKLERKWTNLMRVYRSIKDNKGPRKSGRGAVHYKYFELIDEILGDNNNNNK
ncbi:trihelix transcription factor PTL-like [Photinus pyralis]|uniref:trihelix transcription factor PTL-like n=1 Tax=Photinus pyralis TaxID=7054 RepID=UPI00126702E8|nr:trihelix transcription factor PTL-like [Photinus pyralis]